MESHLENITTNDIEHLSEVQRRCFMETYSEFMDSDFFKDLTRKRLLTYWTNTLKLNPVALKLVLASRIVGYSTGGAIRRKFKNCDSEIYSIYILQEFQKKHLGSLLFDRMLITLSGLGFCSMVLYVLDSNPTVDFYEKKSGKFEGLIKTKYGEKYYNERIYSWDLKKLNEYSYL